MAILKYIDSFNFFLKYKIVHYLYSLTEHS